MKRTEYHQVCDAVQLGEQRTVEHSVTHRHGKVVTCMNDRFEVDVDGEKQLWAPENCDPD